jgi:hypothetical protein
MLKYQEGIQINVAHIGCKKADSHEVMRLTSQESALFIADAGGYFTVSESVVECDSPPELTVAIIE